jgi:hypothetical protein
MRPVPLFSSPPKREQDHQNNENHGPNHNPAKLCMNYHSISGASPPRDEERHEDSNGPSLLPSNKHVTFQAREWPLKHVITASLSYGRIVGNTEVSRGPSRVVDFVAARASENLTKLQRTTRRLQ